MTISAKFHLYNVISKLSMFDIIINKRTMVDQFLICIAALVHKI